MPMSEQTASTALNALQQALRPPVVLTQQTPPTPEPPLRPLVPAMMPTPTPSIGRPEEVLGHMQQSINTPVRAPHLRCDVVDGRGDAP